MTSVKGTRSPRGHDQQLRSSALWGSYRCVLLWKIYVVLILLEVQYQGTDIWQEPSFYGILEQHVKRGAGTNNLALSVPSIINMNSSTTGKPLWCRPLYFIIISDIKCIFSFTDSDPQHRNYASDWFTVLLLWERGSNHSRKDLLLFFPFYPESKCAEATWLVKEVEPEHNLSSK